MRRAFILIIVLILAVAVFAPEVSASRAAPGAFIIQKADTVSALVNQITSNKSVSALYAKHYGIPEDKVVSYFRENLSLVTLKSPMKVTTYFVSRRGKILSKQRLLPAGTKVFATPNGQPVLEWRCGNPLSKQLPAVAKKVPVAATPDPTTLVAANPAVEIGALPVVTAVETPLIPAASTIEPAVQAAIAAPQAIASPNLTAIKVLVPALLGAVAVRSSNDTPPDVPEPMSVVTLIAGVGGVMFQYRRRNRR